MVGLYPARRYMYEGRVQQSLYCGMFLVLDKDGLEDDDAGQQLGNFCEQDASIPVEEFLPKMGSPQPLQSLSSLVRAIAARECTYSLA